MIAPTCCGPLPGLAGLPPRGAPQPPAPHAPSPPGRRVRAPVPPGHCPPTGWGVPGPPCRHRDRVHLRRPPARPGRPPPPWGGPSLGQPADPAITLATARVGAPGRCSSKAAAEAVW